MFCFLFFVSVLFILVFTHFGCDIEVVHPCPITKTNKHFIVFSFVYYENVVISFPQLQRRNSLFILYPPLLVFHVRLFFSWNYYRMIFPWSWVHCRSITVLKLNKWCNSYCNVKFEVAQPSECGREHTLNIVHAQTAAQQQSNGSYEARMSGKCGEWRD